MKRTKVVVPTLVFVAACAGLLWLVVSPRTRSALVSAASAAPSSARLAGASAASSSAGSLAGTVRTEEGEPLVGAHVCATDVESQVVGQPREQCADTEADGRYLIPITATGGYLVSAEAMGFAQGSVARGRPVSLKWGEHKTGIDIVLQRGGAKLSGLVLDATGGPIAGATVHVTRFEVPRAAVAVETEHDGRFAVWVAPGPVTLMADAVGYASAGASHVAPSRDVVLRLTPGSVVQGEVISAIDGKIVPDIEVRAAAVGLSMSTTRPGMSTPEGVFTISGLQPGTYRFSAEGAGWRGQSAAPVEVGLAQHIDRVVVPVSPALAVTGTVQVRATGQPCGQGLVRLGPTRAGMLSPFDPPFAKIETESSRVPSMTASIEPEGEVHFRAVLPGIYHASVQCVDHVLASGPTAIEVGHKNVDGLLWNVEPGLGLVIHVVDEANQPLGGARFRMLFPSRGGAAGTATMPLRADAEGRYEYPGELYAGTYKLEPDGGYDGTPIDVELREGMGRTEATLRLLGQGSVLVRVQSPKADPIDDVTVSAVAVTGATATERTTAVAATSAVPSMASSPPSAAPSGVRTFAGVALGNGRFRIAPLTPGRFRVQVADGINAPAAPNASAGGVVEVRSGVVAQTTVTWDRGGSIGGRVVDGTNQPMPDVWVSASCQPDVVSSEPTWTGPTAQLLKNRIVSDPDGRFMIGNLARDAQCTVRAELPYGGVGVKRDARVGDDVVISLPDLGTLGGTTVGANGEPVEQFTISLQEERTGAVRREVVSAPSGRWRVAKVQPGTLHVSANTQDAYAQIQTELAAGGTAADLRLEFRKVPTAGVTTMAGTENR